jgi:hypothetical protein
LIQLDAQTHAQLRQMDPQQRAVFVAQLQKRRQLSTQRAAAQQQGVTFIRNQVPPQQVRCSNPLQIANKIFRCII